MAPDLIKRFHPAAVDDPQRPDPKALTLLLRALTPLYGMGQRVHQRYAGHPARRCRLDGPVISIGNITTGGTGKTPMTRHVARRLQTLGYKPAIISRGYGGSFERHGGVVSDGRTVVATAAEAGDEPYMLAKQLPGVAVFAGRDRYASGRLALRRYGADVLILDDGFQRYDLARTVDLVLLDDASPLGNGHLLPLGRLREPPESLGRADALIFVRQGQTPDLNRSWLKSYFKKNTIFGCRRRLQVLWAQGHGDSVSAAKQPSAQKVAGQSQRIFAFAGIARHDRFFAALEQIGGRVVSHKSFPDHHPYSRQELADLASAAMNQRVDAIATTAKDYCRFPAGQKWPLPLVVADVAFEFDSDRFDAYLRHRLDQHAAGKI